MARKNQWSQLNHLQLGRYAEYLAKMEFTAYGFDVFTAEVDDKGIDFVVRKSDTKYFDVQVKSCRDLTYIFFPKDQYCGAELPRARGKSVTAKRVCTDCMEIHRNANFSGGNKVGFTWTESALAKNRKSLHAKHQERLRWEAQFSEAELPDVIQHERQRFVTEIFPKLQSVTISQISKQVGISPRYASLVKKGLNVPHPCLYSKFEECLSAVGEIDTTTVNQFPDDRGFSAKK